jgi:hypothetical protein
MIGAAWLRRAALYSVAAVAVSFDATLARAGSLAYETAVTAADRRRVPIIVALGLAIVLGLTGHLALRSRPVGQKIRLGFAVPFLLVSTYWLAFEGGCPFVCRRGGMWNAPVDLRLVAAAAAAAAVSLGSLWINWRRR